MKTIDHIPLWEDYISLPRQEVAGLWCLKYPYRESNPHRTILFLYDPPIPRNLFPSAFQTKILYFYCTAYVKTCSHFLSNV